MRPDGEHAHNNSTHHEGSDRKKTPKFRRKYASDRKSTASDRSEFFFDSAKQILIELTRLIRAVEYIVLGRSMGQIAREKGCAGSTVGEALNANSMNGGPNEVARHADRQNPFGFRVRKEGN